ncbi:MAG: hypothetical protein DHS20C16_16000 [Phycisphaerae bacterium]|nr:MAG: hypothetical protein DHS20C16_16000 [Phycisphaerae bacterium]
MREEQIKYQSELLEKAAFDFLDQLQSNHKVKEEWFERVHTHAQELTKLLKGQEQVSSADTAQYL